MKLGRAVGGERPKQRPLSGYWITEAVSFVGLLNAGWAKMLYSLECCKMGCREDLAVKGTERA